ncbi:MAG: hypothetical protein AMJ90_04650 [candidate division Zixibacteria bacterium SM23_73_2]|nr:MAG: hypothetical protein AMJ90_04650 [candidate division Zixibacteria bacterium SM23_73_2]
MVRWAVAFCIPILIPVFLSSCATVPSSQKYVGSVLDSKSSTGMEESFQTLWDKWTVYFGQGKMGGKPLNFSIPFAMAGGPGGESQFPLQITATLMDSMLIQAGLKHYAAILDMVPEEEAKFRSSYYRGYDPENHLLIWCELRTMWNEIHLDIDRWIVFIEDDAGNQYEPVQIMEESQPFRQMKMDSFSEYKPLQKSQGWEVNQKILMLCFPRHDFSGNPILSERVKFLKLVFQLDAERREKAEGVWVFKE